MLNKILIGLAIVLGVTALVASFNANARLNHVTAPTGLLGVSAQTTPQHVVGSSVTPYPTIYVWGTTSSTGDVEGLEVAGPLWADSGISSGGNFSAGTTTVGKFVQGGSVETLTPAGNIALGVSDICNNSIIELMPSAGIPTITLPTSTLFTAGTCLGTAGNRTTIDIITTGSTSSILSAGGSGVLLSVNSTSTLVSTKLAQLEIANGGGGNFAAQLITGQ